MTIWFFGDSWPAGCELENNQGRDRPELAFPNIVGERLACPVINRSVTGSSVPRIVEEFLDSDPRFKDIAIFCLTAKTRRMYRAADNSIVEEQFNHDEKYVNPYEDERVNAQTSALLYFLCKTRGTVPYFFNLFDTPRFDDRLSTLIPDSHWIIPRKHSVLSWIFDPIFFTRFNDHHNGDFREWLDRDCSLVQKYIRPCQAHPNLQGHEAIADLITRFLIDQAHFKHA